VIVVLGGAVNTWREYENPLTVTSVMRLLIPLVNPPWLGQIE
jgi:hypothetical protein